MRIVGTNRNHSSLVTQYDFRDAGRHHADSVLAGLDALYDRDVCVTVLVLDGLLKLRCVATRAVDGFENRNPGYPSRRPQENLRRSMFPQDLGLDRARIHFQMPSQMESEAEAVEICAGAQDALESALTDEISQGIGRIRHDKHHSVGGSLG